MYVLYVMSFFLTEENKVVFNTNLSEEYPHQKEQH